MDTSEFYVVYNYVKQKIKMTNCMQKNFRQLCSKCRKYNNCKVYADYVEAWMQLQKLAETEHAPKQ